MFNVAKDPECMNDLAQNPEYDAMKNELKAQLVRELKEQGDPRTLGQGHIFDEYIYAHEETRGFYERHMSGEKLNTAWVNETDFEAGPVE